MAVIPPPITDDAGARPATRRRSSAWRSRAMKSTASLDPGQVSPGDVERVDRAEPDAEEHRVEVGAQLVERQSRPSALPVSMVMPPISDSQRDLGLGEAVRRVL
ncbi:MAG: hypothetical protein KatS3mg118_1040 [Paracoccaceae bacterium]|nr:MAG: hypothetical protein KatS3mg118_1040 [Paracoccaceae bacterium]